MKNFLKQKSDNKIIFICWLSYTVAYIGRLNYSASIVAVVESLGITKPEAGLVGSFFFFAYGIGQLVNGILCKRYNAKYMIFASLAVSSILNFLMPLWGDVNIMKYIWMVNGAVQSVLWCTLIKTISQKVSDKNMSHAIIIMSTTVPIGTVIVYALSAIFIKTNAWQNIFYVAAFLLLITAFVWLTSYGESVKEPDVPQSEAKKGIKPGKAIIFALIITALAGIANGFVKDGVTTWVSSLLYEEFNISQSFSVILTLLLPLVSTLGAAVVKKIHKKIQSHTAMNTLYFALASVFCFGILFALKLHSFPLIMLCFIAVAFLMIMINNVITSVFPLDNRKFLDAGFTAGFLNTFCYVGSTITSYALGSIAQNTGWVVTFGVMLCVCLCAAFISALGFFKKQNNG